MSPGPPGQEEDISSVKPIVASDGGQIWIITENVDEFKVGDTAPLKFDRDLMIGDHTGLIKTASGPPSCSSSWSRAGCVCGRSAKHDCKRVLGRPRWPRQWLLVTIVPI